MIRFNSLVRLRPFAGAIALFLASLTIAGTGSAAPDRTPRNEALGAAADIRAAISSLQDSANLTASAAAPYKEAAGRALNALVSPGSADYDSAAGKNGDGVGALERLQWLLQHADNQAWKSGVQSAWVNTMVAKGRLEKARAADGLDEFQSASSSALEALLVAAGSDSQFGSLGGLQGAIATTELGVPADAKRADGCSEPTSGPAYGVVGGYLTYVALPLDGSATVLPESIGVSDISKHNGLVVLHTAASGMKARLCAKDQHAQAASDPKGAAADPVAHLFTEAQAKAGRQVFTSICATCHGSNLQGKSAPAIAGPDFLKKAQTLGWSVSDLRSLITTTMPRSNPGSLSPKQYAEVISYLLAANCYEPGKTAFPTETTKQLKDTKFGPANAVAKKDGASGFCLQPPGQKQAQKQG